MPARHLRIQLESIGLQGMARLAWQNRTHSRLRAYEICRPLVDGRRGIEISGPSAIFARTGPLPSPLFDGLDNCDFAGTTIWHGAAQTARVVYDEERPPGRRFIRDATSWTESRCVIRRRLGFSHARAHREPVAGARRVEAHPRE